MPSINRKAALSLAAVPLAGVLALAVTVPAQAADYNAGVSNITVGGQTINACPFRSLSAITTRVNELSSGTDVTNADVIAALGTSDLADYQRDNCRRSDDGRFDRRRGNTGTTVIDCNEDNGRLRVLDDRYRGARDRYNRYLENDYRRDNSLLNLSLLRGLYDDYLREERDYREFADRRRERVVVDCGDKNSSSAAPAPTTVNNYQVVQAPPGSSSGGSSSLRTPRGGAETGDGSTALVR